MYEDIYKVIKNLIKNLIIYINYQLQFDNLCSDVLSKNREFETCHGTKLKTSYTKFEKEVQCCTMLL